MVQLIPILLIAVITTVISYLTVGSLTGQFIGAPASAVCGNGICDANEFGENFTNCCSDCGCPSGESCNATSNACYAPSIPTSERVNLVITTAGVSPTNVSLRSMVTFTLAVSGLDDYSGSNAWVSITTPSEKLNMVSLSYNSTEMDWKGDYRPAEIGNFSAVFNFKDKNGNMADPQTRIFTVTDLGIFGQVGQFIPVGIQGY